MDSKYFMSELDIERALAQTDPDYPMKLDDYNATIFGCISDGVEWQVMEDSLEDLDQALAWADKANGYGEFVGLYVWTPAN